MAPPSINTPIVIDSDNKWIPLIINAVDRTTSITEQTYDDIHALCAAIQVAIRAVGGGAIIPNATCSVIFTGAVPGMIRFDYSADLGGADTVEMDWLNNAHGSGGADDHIGEKLGIDDSADDGPIGSPWYFTSDWQHQHGWYATRAIRSYGPVSANHIGSKMRRTLSREYAKVLTIGFEYEFEISLEAIPAWHMLWWEAVGANTNRALLGGEVWGHMCEGVWFRFREDQEVAGTYVDYYLVSPRDLFGNLTRKYPDYEGYDLTFRGVLKE